MSAVVIRGDARQLPLPDDSADLVVTSPPYFGLRSYTDGGAHYAAQIGSEDTPAAYVAALLDCTREWMRVLKPSGSHVGQPRRQIQRSPAARAAAAVRGQHAPGYRRSHRRP